MKKIKLFLTFLFITLIFISGCGNKKENKIVKKENDNVPEKKLKILDLNSNSRPIAVMINNHVQARPHSGIQDAFLVYEAVVEGGMSRLMALYKDVNPNVLGSVRSSRPYFLDYAVENDAIYVHFGGSNQALSDIKTHQINNVNGMSDSGFWREKLNVAYEHTAFTNMENIKKVISNKNYRDTTDKDNLLKYSVDEINLKTDDSILANNININYSEILTVNYIYDETNKVYRRYYNNKEHSDRISKEQYTVKNIITIKIEDYNLDSSGVKGLKNIGTGTGYYITNGKAIPISWTKNDRFSQTVYKNLSGEEIKVNDGNTFIQIQPITQKLEIN